MDISEEEQIMEETYMEDNEIVVYDPDEVSLSDESEIDDIESEDFIEPYNELVEQIYEDDSEFLDSDKESGKYYIGLAGKVMQLHNYILLSAISPKTFMKYQTKDVLDYLVSASVAFWAGYPKIHILKLHVAEDDSYTVVIKTFWLKIIQRKWKKIYKERCELLKKYKSLQYLRMREYSTTSNHFPGLNGMYHYGNLNTLVK